MTFKKLRKLTITPFYFSLRQFGKITPDGHIEGKYVIGMDAATGEDRLVHTLISMNPATAPAGNMQEIRQEVLRRWDSLGLLDDLGGKAEAIAQLFENQRSYIINEPEEFAPRQTLMSRYANKMVDSRYYAKISVPVGVSSRGFGIQFKRLRQMPFGNRYLVIGGAWNDETKSFDKVAFPIVRRVFR